MPLDLYPGWTARVRKDPLGPQGFNRLLDCFRWVDALMGVEHLRSTGASVGVIGEHNAAEIPRTVGSVYTTVGPVYNLEGFRYGSLAGGAGVHNPAVGTLILTLGSGLMLYQHNSVQVTNCSESGISKPCVTQAQLNDDTTVRFYSKFLSSALGAGNTWAAEDGHFVAAVYAEPLPDAEVFPGYPHLKGEFLSSAITDLNATIIGSDITRAGMLVGHSAAGLHTAREVARTYAAIEFSTGAYRLLDSSARNVCATVTTIGVGICELTFTNAWTLPAQPFVMVDYARNNSGAVADFYVVCCPRSLITTTKVRYYIYKYDFAALTWARADTDFFTVVHAG